MGIFPNFGGENNKYLKPPPRFIILQMEVYQFLEVVACRLTRSDIFGHHKSSLPQQALPFPPPYITSLSMKENQNPEEIIPRCFVG